MQQLNVSVFAISLLCLFQAGFIIKQTYTVFIREQLHSTTLSDHF